MDNRPAQHARNYRSRQRAAGLKLLQIWVPDPQAPGFAEECRRQARLIARAPGQTEELDFIEQVTKDAWA